MTTIIERVQGASGRTWLIVGAVLVTAILVMWWLWTPLSELEDAAADAEKARAVAEEKAKADLAAKTAELDRIRSEHLSRPVDDGRIADAERQIGQLRGQIARANQLLDERTRARVADTARVGKLSEAELYARVAETLAKVTP